MSYCVMMDSSPSNAWLACRCGGVQTGTYSSSGPGCVHGRVSGESLDPLGEVDQPLEGLALLDELPELRKALRRFGE